jgi:hypothetical protein
MQHKHEDVRQNQCEHGIDMDTGLDTDMDTETSMGWNLFIASKLKFFSYESLHRFSI